MRSSILVNVPHTLAKTVYPTIANCNVSQCQLVKIDGVVQGFSVAALGYCASVLSITEARILIFFFSSLNLFILPHVF